MMNLPESESSPALNRVTGAIIAGLGLLVFVFFVVTGQPFGLAIGAALSFLLIATVALSRNGMIRACPTSQLDTRRR